MKTLHPSHRYVAGQILGFGKCGKPIRAIGGAAITASDIRFRGSTTAGAAGNSTAFGGAGTSLGKYITNADYTDATLNNLFDDVTGDQNAASQVDYQLMFVYNAHATLSWLNPVAWLSSEVAGGTSAAIWVDSTAATAVGGAPVQALTIASKTTAPAASSFSSPTTKGTGLAVSTIAATFVKGIWVRRTAANTAAVDNDGVTIRVEGDTAA